MIDDGSQSTWILAKTAKALKLQVVRRTLLAVSTAFSDDHHAPRLYDVVRINLQTKEGDFYEMEAIVSPSEKLTAKMDAIPLDPSKEYPHLVDIQFADDYPRDAAEIELLISNDHADLIKTGNRRVGKPGEPFGLETLFGWVLSGSIKPSAQCLTSVNFTQVVELENQIEKFWAIEEVPNPKSRIKNLIDEQVHENFKKTITYDDENQQYMVRIPYTEDGETSRESKEQAIEVRRSSF